MSPYLVAITVVDYVSVKSPVHNTSVWASSKDIQDGRGDYALEIAPRIIKFYENLLDAAYPLSKMDLVSESKKHSAMENWGLIIFDPIALLLDPNSPDPEAKWTVTSVVAHELAHQWFGNLVTTDWWSQTWLNEGEVT